MQPGQPQQGSPPQWNEPAGPATQPGPPPSPPAKKQGNPVVGLVVLVVIGVVIWYFFFRSPSSPTTQPGGQPQQPRPTTAAPAPVSVFADISFSGSGDSVKTFTIPSDSAGIVTLTHSGSSNFVVESLDSSGGTNDLLVNTIGRYNGTVLFDETSTSSAFQITADGAWTATIKHPSKARAWTPSSPVSGQGDDVLRLTTVPSGLTPITLSHTGDSNFIVYSYGTTSDLLVNEIDNYSGSVPLPAGTTLVTVESEGSWSITP